MLGLGQKPTILGNIAGPNVGQFGKPLQQVRR